MLATAAVVVSACAIGGLPTTTDPTTTSTTTTVPPTTTTTLRVYRVTGVVTDPLGLPLAGAHVQLGATAQVSDEDGIVVFETTEPGPLAVTKPGWHSSVVGWSGELDRVQAVLAPIVVRGLHVSAVAAGDDEKFAGLLDIAAQSAVNTLVFDTKNESGKVLYDTSVQAAHDIGAVSMSYDPRELVEQAHQRGLYAITRIVTFNDIYWSRAHAGDAMTGAWIDPSAAGARAYNISLAREACEIGFDEVQFDYIRYPSGQAAYQSGQMDLTEDFRVNAIVSFLAEAGDVLEPMGCKVSAAVFGIVVSTESDHTLGQRPEEMSSEVHALSPMLYPSHYTDGWRGFPNPNDFPYEVVAGAIEDAIPRLQDGTLLRPWLQAFWWTNEQILTSIKAAEDRGVGWMLWNWNSNFDLEALPKDDEVDGQ